MAPDVGLSQVFHLLVTAFYLRFDKFVFTTLAPNVLAVGQLAQELEWMTPQFATVWAQILFQLYFFLSCLEDMLAWTPKSFCRTFKKILGDNANSMFTIYTVPINIVMCVNFWVIFNIDPRLMDEYGVAFDVLDKSTNHMVHTHVITILLIEMCITRRQYPSSVTAIWPYIKIAVYFCVYYAVVFGMKLLSPVWPYPLFKAMTLNQWVLFLLVDLLLAYFCYALGYFCNALVWGRRGANSEQRGVESAKCGGDSVRCSKSQDDASKWKRLLRMVQIADSR